MTIVTYRLKLLEILLSDGRCHYLFAAKEAGNESVTNCNQLKLKSPKDGKRYATDVANTEQLLRIIQSVPSKKAEPFKMPSHFILRWHSSFSDQTETVPDTCVYESGTVSLIYMICIYGNCLDQIT